MNKDVLIEIEIENIFNSVDRIKKMVENRPHAYYIKNRIETYLFNTLFFSSFINQVNYHKCFDENHLADSNVASFPNLL